MNVAYPRSVRLTKAQEYNKVFSEAVRLSSNGLVLLFVENGLNYARLGLAISKKHLKLAVQRNLVKRLIREQFRLNQEHLAGADIVVLSRASLATADRRLLSQHSKLLWEKLQKRRDL